MKHTTEPWRYDFYEYSCSISADEGGILDCDRTFTECNEEYDFPRIITCVNACAGIEDPETTIPELVDCAEQLLHACIAEGFDHDDVSAVLAKISQ